MRFRAFGPADETLRALLTRAAFLPASADDTQFWLHGDTRPMTASILTVDDSASLRMAIRIALTGAGYTVTEAADGAEGLAKRPRPGST